MSRPGRGRLLAPERRRKLNRLFCCLQKAILGVTVVAVVLAGSAIVKKARSSPPASPADLVSHVDACPGCSSERKLNFVSDE